MRERGVTAAYEHHEGGAAEVILDCARKLQSDLIGLTTHGRGGLAKLVWGSVAEEVLHHAPCPVLLVRVHEEKR
jgi:nucleotide-binding universal stress UspA family protein